MKKLFYVSILLFISHITNGQINAVTETGRQVILYENGTWKYIQDSSKTNNEADTIAINPTKFFKDKSSTFLVKSKVMNVGIYIDPNKWTLSAHRDNETNPEYRFNLKAVTVLQC